jgi:hypothetical protein
MKFRVLAMSMLFAGLCAAAVMSVRAADDKKAKKDDLPPAPAVALPPGTIKFSSAPAAVQKTFLAESRNSKIELLGQATDGSHYRAIVGIGTSNYQIAVAKDGQLLEKVLEPFKMEVKLEDCPAAVQKTLKEEAKGAQVEAVTKVTEGKASEYAIDVIWQKIPYQVIITDDGTLLSKMISEEEAAAAPKQIGQQPDGKIKK